MRSAVIIRNPNGPSPSAEYFPRVQDAKTVAKHLKLSGECAGELWTSGGGRVKRWRSKGLVAESAEDTSDQFDASESVAVTVQDPPEAASVEHVVETVPEDDPVPEVVSMAPETETETQSEQPAPKKRGRGRKAKA